MGTSQLPLNRALVTTALESSASSPASGSGTAKEQGEDPEKQAEVSAGNQATAGIADSERRQPERKMDGALRPPHLQLGNRRGLSVAHGKKGQASGGQTGVGTLYHGPQRVCGSHELPAERGQGCPASPLQPGLCLPARGSRMHLAVHARRCKGLLPRWTQGLKAGMEGASRHSELPVATVPKAKGVGERFLPLHPFATPRLPLHSWDPCSRDGSQCHAHRWPCAMTG